MSAAARPTWRRWLQPVLGVLILAGVASFLPWRDTLVVSKGPDGPSVTLVGNVDGDWKSERVAFVVDAARREGAWPAWMPPNVERVELVSDGDGGWMSEPLLLPASRVALTIGMPRVFASVERTGFLWALGAFFTAMMFAITRWWRLMNKAGCVVTWRAAFRLSYLGLFFNIVMPGLTGGDVVKAVLAVREHPERRSDALVSVVVDRFLGIFALAFLASVVILLVDTFAELRMIVPPIMLALFVGALVYTSRRVRKLLRFDAILDRLPMARRLRSLDSALIAYRRQPYELLLAFLLSLGNHALAVLGVMSLGLAFGVPIELVGFVDYLVIVPVANIISSLPVAPGGWGVGEMAYAYLFKLMGVATSLGVAVSVGFRICQMVLSLCGGIYLLKPGARADARVPDVQADMP